MRTRNIEFAKEGVSYRDPRDDELIVMETFARHACKCDYCRDPYDTWKHDRPLCSRGLSYARDVANYLYSKGGKPFSVIDRQNGERVEVQVPMGCEVVSLLIKAFDSGMKTTSTRVILGNVRQHEPTERATKSPGSLSDRESIIMMSGPENRGCGGSNMNDNPSP